MDKTAGSITEEFDIYAIGKDEATGKDLVGKRTVSQTLPQSSGNKVLYIYDDDGNLLSDGVWNYTWNGENRLIRVRNSLFDIHYSYDYMGRKIHKKVYTGSTGNWTMVAHSKFVYDNYLQIQ